jgi:hypothetical protein
VLSIVFDAKRKIQLYCWDIGFHRDNGGVRSCTLSTRLLANDIADTAAGYRPARFCTLVLDGKLEFVYLTVCGDENPASADPLDGVLVRQVVRTK